VRSLYSDQPTWMHAVAAWVKLAVLSVCGTLLVLVERPVVLAVACAVVLRRSRRSGRRPGAACACCWAWPLRAR
jgi:biotin transport system permease protein